MRLWQPDSNALQASNLTAFCNKLGLPFAQPDKTGQYNFAGLHQWSIDNREEFWHGVWSTCGVVGTKGDSVLANPEQMLDTQFFSNARLNYAENLLEHDTDAAATALIGRTEAGIQEVLNWDDLCMQVDNLARHFEVLGVDAGDRVAAALPNGITAAVAMLATAKLGAVWCSCSPDFGQHAMHDRFNQIDPVLLLGCDGYSYGGKLFSCDEKMRALAEQLASKPKLLLDSTATTTEANTDPSLSRMRERAPAGSAPLHYRAMPFAAPLFIMFSSGTTGAPKCIVHSIGGTLLKQRSEHALHCNLGSQDKLMFYTTCGWMMWNWLLGALAGGTTLVLYDGSPFYPNSDSLLKIAQDEQLTVLGISPGWLSNLAKNKVRVSASFPKLPLTTLLSTGSPLPDASFLWASDQFGSHVQLSSISGGTDILGCFALGNPWQAVHAGEIQGPALGIALEFFDDSGAALKQQKGELVCTRSFPSQPVGFWNDPEQKKYRAAYFERFDNVWHHGDFGEFTKNGGIIIHGRSDAVLNRGGVRIGTAEIYRQLESFTELLEAVVVAQRHNNDSRIILFVRLAESVELTDALRDRIRQAIRKGTSPRHLPDFILQVADIPRTRSGKIVELAITAVVNGDAVKNTGALANPDALAEFAGFEELSVPG